MKTRIRDTAAQPKSVRDALLMAARRLFSEKGFDGVSVKDLAAETGHNAALVSYYFGSKQGLYRECVMPLVGEGLQDAERTLRPATCRQDFLTRLELFIEDFIAHHLKEQELSIILHRDLHTDVVKQLAKDHLACTCDRLRSFFDAAKKAKILRQDIDADFLTSFVSSTLFNMVAMDRFRGEIGQATLLDKKRRTGSVRQVTNLFLHGALAEHD